MDFLGFTKASPEVSTSCRVCETLYVHFIRIGRLETHHIYLEPYCDFLYCRPNIQSWNDCKVVVARFDV